MSMSWHNIGDLFVEIELRLIASLKRNLSRHKAWEKEERFQWPAWQAEKLKNLEHFRRDNKSIMAEYSDKIDLETRGLMADQFNEGQEQVDKDAPKEFPVPAKPTEDNFFGVNEPRLEKLIDDIQKGEQDAQSAALRMMDDVYRQTVLKAEAAMSAGATTLPQAIDMAVKDFLRAGINCIEYKSKKGETIRRVNIADYVQMALRAAATRSYLQGEAKRRADLGIDTVLVSQYGACSNTCLPWQGRVYIDDVWGSFNGEVKSGRGLSVNGNWYPLLSVAVKAGLFHPNCRHTVSTWYEGISKLPDPMDVKNIRENSVLEQQQRGMERRIRMYKRMVEGLHEPDLVKQYKRKTADAQKELRNFINEHDDVLRRDYWREKTFGVVNISQFGYNMSEDQLLKPTKVLFGHQSIPPKGEPNEIIDVIGHDGHVSSRNLRDSEGKLIKQINPTNHGNPKRHPFGEKGEHAHDVLWDNNKIVGRPMRELTEQERKENGDML